MLPTRHINEEDGDVEGDHRGRALCLHSAGQQNRKYTTQSGEAAKPRPSQEALVLGVDVWVFVEAVRLGMVLEVHAVPWADRDPLQVAE